MGLGFWSKQPHAFSRDDVSVARRIADHVALAVSHEQLAEAARQVAEARGRAERLEARVQSLAEELHSKTDHARVVGRSGPWMDVLKRAAQVAETETTVLLSGESGTGKEVVARFIHRASPRKGGPFVALNCAALPEQLLESELFGYERGAFTGAQQAKPGQIELANAGVLFLDEVSEMSPSAQAKFLRVLQEREFQRLGGIRLQKANVRVIAATNRDLKKAVERGDFREDLYYRLQVFDIRIAPLRERPTDILDLSEAFLVEIGRSFGRPPAGLTRDAREALLQHDWPGNVRELRNALERAAILCEGGLIGDQHLSLQPRVRSMSPETTDLNLVERQTIEQVMRDSAWNKSQAAKRLGLSRTQLYAGPHHLHLERKCGADSGRDDPLRHDEDGATRDLARAGRVDGWDGHHGQCRAAWTDSFTRCRRLRQRARGRARRVLRGCRVAVFQDGASDVPHQAICDTRRGRVPCRLHRESARIGHHRRRAPRRRRRLEERVLTAGQR
jgi:transcriptional regulator with PAS, ATPase and Fis domain